MGIGRKNTPKPFVNACDLFVYTENLSVAKNPVRPKPVQNPKAKKTIKEEKEESELDPMPLLEQAFEMAVQENGWASLATLGNALYQLDPGFDPRTYGYKQLSKMISNLKNRFDVKTSESGGFYVKTKE